MEKKAGKVIIFTVIGIVVLVGLVSSSIFLCKMILHSTSGSARIEGTIIACLSICCVVALLAILIFVVGNIIAKRDLKASDPVEVQISTLDASIAHVADNVNQIKNQIDSIDKAVNALKPRKYRLKRRLKTRP